MVEVTLGFSLGATLLVDGVNWAKPANTLSVKLAGLPDDGEMREAWDWLVGQVVASSDELFEVIRTRIREVPPQGFPRPGGGEPVKPWRRTVVSGEPPPHGVYD